MLKFNMTGGPYGDCTSSYEVLLDKEYTVGEFVRTVINERSKEWGSFNIKNGVNGLQYLSIPYKNGNVYGLTNNLLSDRKIRKVCANGGWSSMDYYIEL